MPASMEAKRRARRIPAENRKRGVQSCDLCRKKRCKCIDAPGMEGRCLTCLHQNLACTYTLPRKTRFYGNVEDLSDRYRCLEAIVRGAFPDAPLGSTAELMQLGQSMGYAMPNLSQPDERDQEGPGEPIIKHDDSMQVDSGHIPQTRTPSPSPSAGPSTKAGDAAQRRFSSSNSQSAERTRSASEAGPLMSNQVSGPLRRPSQAQSSGKGGTTTPPSLVRDAVGREHYIGPSGGLQYLSRLRRVLINHEQRVRAAASARESEEEEETEEEEVVSRGAPRTNDFTADDGALSLEVEVPQESVDSLTAQDQQQPIHGEDAQGRGNVDEFRDSLPRGDPVATHALHLETEPRQGGSAASEAGLTPGSVTTTATRTGTAIQEGTTPKMSTPSATSGKLLWAGMEEWWMRFPAQEVVERHLNSYFQNVHDDFPLFHRGTFEDEYETHFKFRQQRRNRRAAQRQQHTSSQPQGTQQPPSAKTDSDTIDLGWIACLHMMLVFGSTALSPSQTNPLSTRHHVATTRSLLPTLVSKCTLSNLRALLLLALWLHNNNERNAAWNLVGVAARIAFALGLHRPADTGVAFRPVERELRKRVFCTLFALEQFLAGSLDRPSGLADADVQVVPPREALLDGGGGGLGAGAGEGDAAGLAGRTLELHRILGRSRVKGIFGGMEQERSAEEVLAELRAWATESRAQQWFNIPPVKTGLALLDEDEDDDDDAREENKPGGRRSSDPSRPIRPRAMSFDGLRTMLSWQSRSRLRATLLLRMQYHYISVTVTRAFLLRDLASSSSRSTGPGEVAASSFDASGHRGRRSLGDTCLWHAGQLALTGLLLDEFGLVNGVSALDIFYLYWACMILCLGMLHNASSKFSASSGSKGDSDAVKAFADLVTRLNHVAAKVEKGVTMRRFVTLMIGFADYATHRCLPARSKAARKNRRVIASRPAPGGQRSKSDNAVPGAARGSGKVNNSLYSPGSAFSGHGSSSSPGVGGAGPQPQHMPLSHQHHQHHPHHHPHSHHHQQQAALDSAYWSQAMLPLGTTIEGGTPVDSYSWMTGMDGLGFTSTMGVDGNHFDPNGGNGTGNEWMGFLLGSGDMDISMMGGDDNFVSPGGQNYVPNRSYF